MANPHATNLTDDLLDTGCSCHLNPPCTFCVSLDEEERDAYIDGGVPAIRALLRRREEQATDDPPPTPLRPPIGARWGDLTEEQIDALPNGVQFVSPGRISPITLIDRQTWRWGYGDDTVTYGGPAADRTLSFYPDTPDTPAPEAETLRARVADLEREAREVCEALRLVPYVSHNAVIDRIGHQRGLAAEALASRVRIAELERDLTNAREHTARIERYHAGPAQDDVNAAMEKLATDANAAEARVAELEREANTLTTAIERHMQEKDALRGRVAELEREAKQVRAAAESETDAALDAIAAHVKLTTALRAALRLTDPRDEAIIEAVIDREIAAVEARLAREEGRLTELRRMRGGM